MKPAALLLITFLTLLLSACGNNRSFEATAWHNGDARARGRMSQDLVDRKILVGQTLEEAKSVLGLPEKDWGTVLQYQIDLGWAFKDPSHYGLQVHLDQNQNVREVKIVD